MTTTMNYTEDQAKIAALLGTLPKLAEGVGTESCPCSIAAVNLALTGELTDDRPLWVSPVIHAWVIQVQDHCPADLGRDSAQWRQLLPRIAGTAGGEDGKRVEILIDWMFTCLQRLQSEADAGGYGEQWARMCSERTRGAVTEAENAALHGAGTAYDDAAAAADSAGYALAETVDPRARPSGAASATAYAVRSTADGIAHANANTRRDFWAAADIPAVLQTLINA